jgi:hypothetical protein
VVFAFLSGHLTSASKNLSVCTHLVSLSRILIKPLKPKLI